MASRFVIGNQGRIVFTQIFTGRHRGAQILAARGRWGRSAGFTYIGLLVLIAAMGFGLTVVAQVWQTAQTRDKEEELLFVGNEFRHAIGMYVANTSSYPRSLEDLLKDPTFPGVRRYLRRIYRDPITGRAEWGLLKPDGNAIIGVYSLSDAEPMKQGGFSLADQGFEAKKKYSEWIFSSKAGQGPQAAMAPLAPQQSGVLPVLPAPAAQVSAGAPTPGDSGTITPADPGTAFFDPGWSGPGRMGPRGRR